MSSAGRLLAIVMLGAGTPLAAQQALEMQTGTPPERIDLLADARNAASEPPSEDCSPQTDDFQTEGPIIVCRRRQDDSQFGYDREAAAKRYAERTMDKGDPRTPDVSGPGIFTGPATVGKLCIPGLQKCPPPPAYMVDFASIPEAPPGSDADRAARGLAPLGSEGENSAVDPRIEELALPAAPDAALSPSRSASPAAAP